MTVQIYFQILSNLISIILVILLLVTYIKYKKSINKIQNLSTLKSQKKLTNDDLIYIDENYKFYEEKSEKADALSKITNPIFIFASGILFLYLPFSDAMIHLNVVVVAFIYVQLDKTNKKNTLILLSELKN